jgi:hypothetical protein
MSEHPSVGINIDSGIAEALKTIPDVIGVKFGTMLNRAKAKAQHADLKQAQATLRVVREIGAYLQKLRFDQYGGLRWCIARFARAPTFLNSWRLRRALDNSRRVMSEQYQQFDRSWAAPDTYQYFRNEFPELTDVVNIAVRLKQNLYDEALSAQTWSECVPFLRSRRYRRLAQYYEPLNQIFDEINRVVDHARDGIRDVIAILLDRVSQLSRFEPGRQESQKKSE